MGKHVTTERLQRKASGTPPPRDAPAAQPFGPVDAPEVGPRELSGSQSFLDSILSAPVQRSAHGEGADRDVHSLAAAGTAGAGGELPFLDQIQASFGAHDVTGVQAHTDGDAADAARGMGATAFATGNHVAFAGAPDLHTAAHEAAHVVQQRAGVHLKGGVGEEGDACERHADAVADRVVRGESVEALLGPASGDSGSGAVQRKAGTGTPTKADLQEAEAQLRAADQLEAEDHFLDTIAYYLQFQHFRTGGRGPLHPRQQKTPTFHTLAEQVRAAQLIYVNHTIPDRERKALDAWGPARQGVMKAILSAGKRGSAQATKALEGVRGADAYFAGDVVDKAVKDAEADVAITSPDSGFLAETQRAVDKATVDAMELMKAVPGTIAPQVKAHIATVNGVSFEEWYALVQSSHDLDDRLKKAKAKGLVASTDTVADMLRGALVVTKVVVTAINAACSWLLPAAQAEARQMFASLAKVTGDATITSFGELLSKALGIVQIVAGAIGLIRGIANGDVKQALKGASRIAGGGVSLGMLGVGAGLGASAMAAGGVLLFFATLEAVVEVGALLRDMKRQQTLEVAYEFLQDAAKIAVEARHFAASVEVMLAQATHSSDAAMQNEVEARVEEQALALGQKLAKQLQWLGQQIWSSGKSSIGGHPDLVSAMGRQTTQSLGQLAMGIADEPLMVAQHCTWIFAGIGEMGRYAMKQYGKPS